MDPELFLRAAALGAANAAVGVVMGREAPAGRGCEGRDPPNTDR